MSQDLQLYQARLDISPTECDRLWQILSEDERSRADRFKREYLKRNFIAARGNLREILAPRLGCEASAIQFGYSDRGKPYIQNFNGLHFNLSHSQDLAIYVICQDREVGIDLEFINSQCDVDSIAKRYFLPSEQKVISYLCERDKYLAFYRAWTLKEAYGKATGEGIANILDQVDVTPLLECPMGETLRIQNWNLKLIASEFQIDLNYSAALCFA
ncbi:4'-phosphopantetheinyl transferase family protein [Phormidium tenue]|uniref:4'-phosphopantetheinyl transferase superfamily protein n=1 Tax=Phormidium tenue FACHB-1050 TaxID=2692857 RepID=A0ABR8CCZ7_9CYAN|nr:4'-phosphopantetheinyl transferase superfamily protein [Phormidium tenue]MBD2317825.1 4'-phosphopantetheinyl transferase superfamily protein [Phormidium tenue FACHB-1050]